MKKILFLLLISLSALGQRNGLIDADWTAAWAARFATQSTSGLSEGGNLYYTDARVGAYGDARYGRLASTNSWTGSNTMSPTLGGTSGTSNLLISSPTTGGGSNIIFENSATQGKNWEVSLGGNNANGGSGTGTSEGNIRFRNTTDNIVSLILHKTGNVGIGGNPNTSAQLDVSSTTRGFLPPRMTTAQINAIASPATGLVAYSTDLQTLCFYNGTSWQKVTSTNMN